MSWFLMKAPAPLTYLWLMWGRLYMRVMGIHMGPLLSNQSMIWKQTYH